MRYTRDNTKNLDEIAAEILDQVKRSNSENSETSSSDSTPNAKRRKITHHNKKYDSTFPDNGALINHIDTNELQRRVAAILGQTRHMLIPVSTFIIILSIFIKHF